MAYAAARLARGRAKVELIQASATLYEPNMPPTIKKSERYRGAVVVVVTAMIKLVAGMNGMGQLRPLGDCTILIHPAHPTIPNKIGVNR